MARQRIIRVLAFLRSQKYSALGGTPRGEVSCNIIQIFRGSENRPNPPRVGGLLEPYRLAVGFILIAPPRMGHFRSNSVSWA